MWCWILAGTWYALVAYCIFPLSPWWYLKYLIVLVGIHNNRDLNKLGMQQGLGLSDSNIDVQPAQTLRQTISKTFRFDTTSNKPISCNVLVNIRYQTTHVQAWHVHERLHSGRLYPPVSTYVRASHEGKDLRSLLTMLCYSLRSPMLSKLWTNRITDIHQVAI